MLLAVVHSEEEFDWNAPFDRGATSVGHARALPRLQAVFEAAGVRPVYLMDHPFAAQPESAGHVAEAVGRGAAWVGAHLHPWVSPPHVEQVTTANSYASNLPAELEAAKIAALTETIEQALGVRPRTFLAGSYGFGPATGAALRTLGYTVDLSPSPTYDYSADGGPDFTDWGCHPSWDGPDGHLLRIPHTAGHAGFLCRGGRRFVAAERQGVLKALKVPAILARTKAQRRVRLSPEGFGPGDMIDLTRALVAAGHRLFVFSLHSPSLAPGHTPYARSAAEVDRLLDAIAAYLDYFQGRLGGRVVAPEAALAAARQASRPSPPAR